MKRWIVLDLVTWLAVAVTFVSSSVLCKELARRYHKDQVFYAVSGLVLGPLCLMIVMTPLPVKKEHLDVEPVAEPVERGPHVIEGPVCPDCHKHLPVRVTVCSCGCDVETPWWDRTTVTGNS
jgi:hypothetical protein